jgi:hypothetical protein
MQVMVHISAGGLSELEQIVRYILFYVNCVHKII